MDFRGAALGELGLDETACHQIGSAPTKAASAACTCLLSWRSFLCTETKDMITYGGRVVD